VSASLFDQLQATLGGAYRLERELGGGGMSRVFLAHETALGRRVVVKVLLPELAAGVSVDRFRREIQLAAQLQHPHIVPLLSAGEFGGLPYFTMPFISGESLRTRLSRTGELPINETVRILRDVVSAISYAHENGVMHRDVKPDNVLLSGGVAVVTDFGVAKAVSVSTASPTADITGLTSLGMALGTPNYMAPEQASGDPQIDHRVDIYALGIMGYEMLAGRTPFGGRSTQAVLAAHMIEQPEPLERLRPSVTPALAALLMQSMAKRPADRPQSAMEILHALDAIGTPTGGIATTTVTPRASADVTPPPARRARPAVVAGISLIALLAFGILWRIGPLGPSTGAETSAGGARSTPGPAPVPEPPVRLPLDTTAPPAPPTPAPPAVERRTPPASAPARARRPAAEPPKRVTPPPVIPETDSSPPADSAPPTDSAPAVVPSTTPPPADDSALQAAPAPARMALPPPPAARSDPPAARPPQPAPAPGDARAEVSATVAAFARAIESGSVENLRRVYPEMTPAQQRGWQQFFETVRDVKAQLTVDHLNVGNGTADARVTGTYGYRNSSTGRTEVQPVAFRATLRRESGGWRIVQVR
jgi:serine/threonine protein kinase